MTVLFDADWKNKSKRRCGGCTLCCRLLPVHHGAQGANGRDLPGSWHKPSGQRCQHQRSGKGCAVYQRAGFPISCALWNCRWLVNADTADLARPDRSRYVIDITPDFVTISDNDSGESIKVEVVQVWCDPKHREAWRDPALLAYLMRRGAEGVAAIIRWSARDALVVFPPNMAGDGQWHESAGTGLPDRPPGETYEGVAEARKYRSAVT
jgi:hypothetical protein